MNIKIEEYIYMNSIFTPRKMSLIVKEKKVEPFELNHYHQLIEIYDAFKKFLYFFLFTKAVGF